jgi:hypothetical protein
MLLLMVGGALWADIWLLPEPVLFEPSEPAAPLYQLIQVFFVNYPKPGWVLAFIFLILQAILLNQIIASQGIVERHSFLASLIYVILMSSSTGLVHMHPVLFSNFFMILALNRLLRMYNQNEQQLEVFNVGMFISLAGLFYAPAWLFFILLLVTLFIFFLVDLRSFLAAIIGFIFPFVLLITFYVLRDIPLQMLAGEALFYGGLWPVITDMSLVYKILLGFVAGLSSLAIFHLVALFIPDKPIRLRKRLWVVVYLFFIALLITITTGPHYPYHIGLLCVPTTILLAGFFHQIERKLIAEILFSMLIVLVLAGKYLQFI